MRSIGNLTVINSQPISLGNYFEKLWRFRNMVIRLTIRDLRIRYSQTLLGVLWAVIQPLTGLLIFTIFFDRLIKIEIPGIPYPLFAFAGMVSWFFFSQIVYNAGTSLVESQNLIKKVYFPRMLLLVSKVLAACVEFGISLLLLVILMIFMGRGVKLQMLFLPGFILLNICVGLSIAIWLSALTVRYRDFQHIIPYLVNFGIWLTPVFYPATLIPAEYSWFLYLNPMAAVIAGFRWSIIGGAMPEIQYLLSLIPTFFLLITGFDYFRRVENDISDYI